MKLEAVGLLLLATAIASTSATSLRAVKDMSVPRRMEAQEYQAAMTGSRSPFCFIEKGFDFVGRDLYNVPGATADACCQYCSPAQGCNAYSWTNYNNGTCWLKTGRGAIVVNPNVKSALVFYSPQEVCGIKEDVDFEGDDYDRASSVDAEGCCQICRDVPRCRAFSWTNYNGGMCWLKTGKGRPVVKPGVRSGEAYPAPQGDLVCAQQIDVDYVNHDIGNKPSANAGGCCNICRDFPGCRAYSWSNQNGGTCYLKSLKGATISKPGVISAQVFNNPPPLCDFEADTDYVGNDIANVASADAGLCCTICRDRSDCKAVSWSNYNGGTCWLKNAKGASVVKPGVKSVVIRT